MVQYVLIYVYLKGVSVGRAIDMLSGHFQASSSSTMV